MKSDRVVIGVLVVLSLLVLGVLVIGAWPYFRPPPTYRFSVGGSTWLTDDQAIYYSKLALMKWGIDGDELHPVQYVPVNATERVGDDLYFARNILDGRKGSVTWMSREGCYAVNVEQIEQTVECRIHFQK